MDAGLLPVLFGTPKPKFKVDFTAISTLPNEITFSRAGNAMQADATGALTWAPNNGVPWSQAISNWSKLAGGTAVAPIVTDNFAAAPDGTSTASRVQFDRGAGTTSGDLSRVQMTTTSLKRILLSVYMKTNDASTKSILMIVSGTGHTDTKTVTGSWTQFTFLSEQSTSGTAFNIALRGDVGASATADILIWGAQWEAVTYQTTPGPYVATTTAAYYGPRFDNTLGTANAPLGLLIEESRTNVGLWNRDLTNAAWTLGATMTRAKDQIGIDGVANSASSITGGAVSGTNTILQAIVLTSSARFQSAYVKRLVGTGVVNMTTDGGTTWTAITVTAAWTRVTIPTQTLANPSVGFQIMTSTNSIAVDFVQNENGTFATSPIFTTTAAVTRAAEAAYIANATLARFYNGASGAFVVEANTNGNALAGILCIQDSTGANDLSNYMLSSSITFRASITVSSVVQFTNSDNGPDMSQIFRSGLTWTAGNSASSINGRPPVVFSGGAIPALGTMQMNLGDFRPNFSKPINGYMRRIAIYTKRLPNLTLQAKTVLGAPL